MKLKFIYLSILLIIFAYTVEANLPTSLIFSPISTVYHGIESDETKIVAYGDYGSLNISYDLGTTWKKQNIFHYGFIINLFINKDTITAFNSDGNVTISYDNGNSWKNILDLQEEIYSVLKIESGYFIRSDHKLTLIDRNGKIIKQNELNSKEYFDAIKVKYEKLNIKYILYLFKNSVSYFNNSYYIFNNIKSFDVYDVNLQLINNINTYTDNTIDFFVNGSFINYDNFLYFQINNKWVKTIDFINFIEVKPHPNNFVLGKSKKNNNEVILLSQESRAINYYKLQNDSLELQYSAYHPNKNS